jgi:hypothetical protein
MEAGEKELRKIFEENTTRNVKACVEHGNNTRTLQRQLENKVILLEGILRQYAETFASQQLQLTNLQSIVYREGTK